MTDVPMAVLGPIEPGSLILLDARALPPDYNIDGETFDFLGTLYPQLVDRVGHDQFLLVALPFTSGEPPARLVGSAELLALIRAPQETSP